MNTTIFCPVCYNIVMADYPYENVVCSACKSHIVFKEDEKINLLCKCGKKISIRQKHANKKIKCPQCSKIMIVPKFTIKTNEGYKESKNLEIEKETDIKQEFLVPIKISSQVPMVVKQNLPLSNCYSKTKWNYLIEKTKGKENYFAFLSSSLLIYSISSFVFFLLMFFLTFAYIALILFWKKMHSNIFSKNFYIYMQTKYFYDCSLNERIKHLARVLILVFSFILVAVYIKDWLLFISICMASLASCFWIRWFKYKSLQYQEKKTVLMGSICILFALIFNFPHDREVRYVKSAKEEGIKIKVYPISNYEKLETYLIHNVSEIQKFNHLASIFYMASIHGDYQELENELKKNLTLGDIQSPAVKELYHSMQALTQEYRKFIYDLDGTEKEKLREQNKEGFKSSFSTSMKTSYALSHTDVDPFLAGLFSAGLGIASGIMETKRLEEIYSNIKEEKKIEWHIKLNDFQQYMDALGNKTLKDGKGRERLLTGTNGNNFMKALIYFYKEDYATTLAILSELTSNIKDSYILYYLKGIILYRMNFNNEAILSFISAINYSKLNKFVRANCYSYISRDMFENKMYEKALWNINSTLNLLPFNVYTLEVKGYILYKAGHMNQSKSVLEKAINIDNNIILGHYYLSCIYSIENNKSKSLEHFKNALKNGYNDIASTNKDIAMKNLRSLPEYEKLTKINFAIQIQWGLFNDDIIVYNKNIYEWTNVNIEITVYENEAYKKNWQVKTWSSEHKLDLVNAFSITKSIFKSIKVSINCDQGRGEHSWGANNF